MAKVAELEEDNASKKKKGNEISRPSHDEVKPLRRSPRLPMLTRCTIRNNSNYVD